MSLSRIRRTLVPAAMAVALLSACSSNVAAPGVALSIGDDSIAKSQVHDVADAVCRSIGPNLAEAGERVPMAQVRQYALSLLTVRLQAEQVADEQDVDAGAAYEQDVVRWQEEAAGLPEELREDYVSAMSTEAYLTSVMAQLGERELAAEGVAAPSEEQVMQRGSEFFATEVVERDTQVDPSFGVVMVDGVLQLGETGTSVPVSANAVEALGEQPSEAYLDSLTESQRCG